MSCGIQVSTYAPDTEAHRALHTHAGNSEFSAVLGIPEGSVPAGRFPEPQTKRVPAWTELHRDGLHLFTLEYADGMR
jgi:hypothetical protein